jgi:hypothetical protein
VEQRAPGDVADLFHLERAKRVATLQPAGVVVELGRDVDGHAFVPEGAVGLVPTAAVGHFRRSLR